MTIISPISHVPEPHFKLNTKSCNSLNGKGSHILPKFHFDSVSCDQ